MVTDEQVRRLRKLSNTEKNQEIAASKAGMDPTTARRYLGLERLPSELKKERPWRTREDPFGEVWDAVQRQIQESPGLEAKTLFEWLQREYPGRFSDGQIRTLQRRIKLWWVTEGPAQEVYFGQKHEPGTVRVGLHALTELGITLAGRPSSTPSSPSLLLRLLPLRLGAGQAGFPGDCHWHHASTASAFRV